jgi:hypothetical protein
MTESIAELVRAELARHGLTAELEADLLAAVRAYAGAYALQQADRHGGAVESPPPGCNEGYGGRVGRGRRYRTLQGAKRAKWRARATLPPDKTTPPATLQRPGGKVSRRNRLTGP